MKVRDVLLMLGLFTGVATAWAAPTKTSSPRTPSPAATAAQPLAQTASRPFLPDSTLLARVEDRVIRVGDFRNGFYASTPEDRSNPDSLGRLEVLNNLINKEIMGLTARSIPRDLTFEDRAQLRGETNTILLDILYRRVVGDSVSVSDAEARAYYPGFSQALNLRHILFDNAAIAARVRKDLMTGRIAWSDAVRRYTRAFDPGENGEMGWTRRTELHGDFAIKTVNLRPGGYSEIIQDADGWHLLQCVDRHAVDPPPYSAVRRILAADLRMAKAEPFRNRLYDDVRRRANVQYDSTNIRWTAELFRQSEIQKREAAGGSYIDMAGKTPSIGVADTGRVLARKTGARYTLVEFVDKYRTMPAALRPRIGTPGTLIRLLDAQFLEPELVQVAEQRGIERDSRAQALIAKKLEGILVDHLFEDSVMRRVSVSTDEMRRYYESRKVEFSSIPWVRYAQFLAHNEKSADSLVAAIGGGAKAEELVRADSLRGRRTSELRVLRSNDPSQYHNILFEELRPGQATKVGPDARGDFLVLALVHFDAPRQMSFDEVRSIVDESLQNIKSQQLLEAFLARHRAKYRIESHPELLSRVNMLDPALEWGMPTP